jgi:hypothetical protein
MSDGDDTFSSLSGDGSDASSQRFDTFDKKLDAQFDRLLDTMEVPQKILLTAIARGSCFPPWRGRPDSYGTFPAHAGKRSSN